MSSGIQIPWKTKCISCHLRLYARFIKPGNSFLSVQVLNKEFSVTHSEHLSSLCAIILCFQYELLFCIQDRASTDLIELVNGLIAKHPLVDARVFIGKILQLS